MKSSYDDIFFISFLEQTESCIDAEDRKSCSDTDDDAIDPERQNKLQGWW